MKTLTKEDVLDTAETLMNDNGSTTTLDVKNKLRNLGFQAMQADVSRWMDELAREERWNYNQQSGHRVYTLGADTDDTTKKYMERGSEFWEIEVEKKRYIIGKGKVGTDGTTEEVKCSSNRKATKKAKEQIADKAQEGFQTAQDKRLPLHLRQRFGQYFGQIPTYCKLGYYDIKKTIRARTVFTSVHDTKSGYVEQTLNLGLSFTWALPTSLSGLQAVLQQKTWQVSAVQADEITELGKKSSPLSAFEETGAKIPTEYKPNLAQAQWETIEWEVSNEQLFQVIFGFANGETVRMSKFDLDWVREIIPVAQRILTAS
jgi:predicted DNA-binding WGR domain protein